MGEFGFYKTWHEEGGDSRIPSFHVTTETWHGDDPRVMLPLPPHFSCFPPLRPV